MKLFIIATLTFIVFGLSAVPTTQAGSTGPLRVQGWVKATGLAVQATANDRYFVDQWYFDKLKIPTAWDVTTGSPVTIAIIDTGADLTHPDLSARLWTNPREIAANGSDDDGNGYIDDVHGYNFVSKNANLTDRHGHGTGVSSVIAAATNNRTGIAGVNQQARLMILKSLDQAGGGEYKNVTQAVRYAVDNGAKLINMSFGATAKDADLEAAINYAASRNVIIVAAAGNAGDNEVYYPAASEHVISVGSVGKTNKRSSFSNYGAGLDIVAPGEGILMAEPDGDYVSGAGTSFATALVTGVVSLATAVNPGLTPDQAENLLHSTAVQIGSSVPNSQYGYGLADAAAMTAQPAKQLANQLIASNASPLANGLEQTTITVIITDQNGTPQSNLPVTLRASGGGTIINGVPSTAASIGVTDGAGRVVAYLASVMPGAHTITAETGLTTLPSSQTINFRSFAARYQMQWLTQSPYPTLEAGESTTLSLEVINTGNVAWITGDSAGLGALRLATDVPQDRTSQFRDASWISGNRVATMSPAVVRPGETARFNFRVTAPSQPGQYKEYFRPVAEYISWLNDLGIYWEIRVTQ